ncbi:DUF4126 domain-containing protein [Xanthomonadaceae bacterium JHOS43]|jgi:hypothetical protein|nr:DUF4126 domain-containing protein [Xanthomonadaceae bacterium JHOS43]MCX7562289.1 DUF4126 domain-containing protein [Xanthomonadaceae bacterium XH05]
MSEAQVFALGVTLAWLAGIRAYLTVFGLGVAGWFGWIELPGALAMCSSPWVLGVSGLLAAVEFGTDKIPGVDSVWDLLQTVLRVPAGAFLASAALAGPEGEMGLGWAMAGGGAALLSHTLKSGTRALLNTSPEPVSNMVASVGEDTLALGTLALVFAYPWLALSILLLLTLGVALAVSWLARRMWHWRARRT